MLKEFIERLKILGISEKDTLYVGTSGGGDSQALACLLMEAKESLHYKLHFVHVHHGLRETADRDALFVQKFAEKNHIPCTIFRGDARALAKEKKISIESAARELRYGFFNQVLEENPSGKLFLAHHMEDQAETILMRILRGTGIDGLKGMAMKRGRIYRPLLDSSKHDLLAYLEERGENYCFDETNADNFALRNRIRNEIFPMLQEINPNVTESLYRLGENAKETLEVADSVLEDLWKTVEKKERGISFNRNSYLKRPASQRRFFLHSILHTLEIQNYNREQILFWDELILRGTGKDQQGDTALYVSSDLAYLGEPINYPPYQLKVDEGKVEIPFDSLNLWVKSSNIVDMKKNPPNAYRIYADQDKLKALTLRNRKDGDVFSPFGFKGKKKLKDFFIDEKIPFWERDRVPLILSGENILWVVGYRRSDLALVDVHTKNMICIEGKREEK